jgi:hypothetical protein
MLSRPTSSGASNFVLAGATDARRLNEPASILNVRTLPGAGAAPPRCLPKQATLSPTAP